MKRVTCKLQAVSGSYLFIMQFRKCIERDTTHKFSTSQLETPKKSRSSYGLSVLLSLFMVKCEQYELFKSFYSLITVIMISLLPGINYLISFYSFLNSCILDLSEFFRTVTALEKLLNNYAGKYATGDEVLLVCSSPIYNSSLYLSCLYVTIDWRY